MSICRCGPDWLDRRREEIIEPDLPIVEPHHHLVDRPETGRYLVPELLADTGSGHNITATVYLEWLSMYRAQGPAELRPVGEIEFANAASCHQSGDRCGQRSATREASTPCYPVSNATMLLPRTFGPAAYYKFEWRTFGS